LDQTFNGGCDAYLITVSADGASLLCSTFFGGTRFDYGYGIAIGEGNRIVVSGQSDSPDLPTTPDVFDPSFNGGTGDIFVADMTCTNLSWCSFVGGNEWDFSHGLYLGCAPSRDIPGECVVVVGSTESSNYPTTENAYDRSFNGGSDAVITVLTRDGTALIESTYLGGSSYDYGWHLASDPHGNPIIAGETGSAAFPTTPGSYDPTFNGYADVFVSKLDMSPCSSVPEIAGPHRRLLFEQIHPNPFQLPTWITFDLPTQSRVEVEIFDVTGRRVCCLANQIMEPGCHSVSWSGLDDQGRPVRSGVYLVAVRGGGVMEHRTLTLVR
jgi:hypothetical protein